MRCLTFIELLGLEAIVIAVIAYVGSIIMPEFRRRLGLDPPTQYSAQAEKVIWGLWILLICIAIGLILWFLVCRVSSSVRNPLPRPSPSPASQVGPVIIERPIEVDGKLFQLYIFSPQYHWEYGTINVQFAGQIVPEARMMAYLKDLAGTLTDADAILCVGTASYDIQRDEPFEEQRASTRAQQLDTWMRPVVSLTKKDIDVYQLNLGHYRGSSDSDEQRLILLVKVKIIDMHISLGEVLAPENSTKLKQKLKEKDFPFKFDSFSLFELRKTT